MALMSSEMEYAGELMASSIVHGGPAPNFLAKWVYEYFIGGLPAVADQLNIDQISDQNAKAVASVVRNTFAALTNAH